MSLNLIIENCVTAGKEITKKLVQKRKSESCRERCMYAHGLSLVQSHRRAGWEARWRLPTPAPGWKRVSRSHSRCSGLRPGGL